MNKIIFRRHWVFDLDGTLVDSFPGYFSSLTEVLAKHGVKISIDDCYRALTMHRDKFMSEYLSAGQLDSAVADMQRMNEEDAGNIKTFPGIENALKILQEKKIKMAVWTGRDLRSAEMILESTGLKKYFEICIGSDSVENHKPNPDGLSKIQKKWNCSADSLVMVGDHDVDLHGAKALKVFFARVSWVHRKPEKCEHSDKQFYHVKDFEQWIRKEI